MKATLIAATTALVVTSSMAMACEDCDGLGADATAITPHTHVAHDTTSSTGGVLIPIILLVILAAAAAQ